MPSPSAGRIGRTCGDRAVAQDDVGLPLHGVARWKRLVLHGAHRATLRDPGPDRAHWAPWSYATPSCTAAWCAASTRPGRWHPRSSATSSPWACAPRAPGSARAGTSWPCSTRPTGRRSGRPPTTAPRRTPGAAACPPPPPSCCACRDPGAYLDRYAQPDKGWTDRSTDHWPVPYWDTDVAMAAMVMLLGARGRRPGRAVLRGARRAARRGPRGVRHPRGPPPRRGRRAGPRGRAGRPARRALVGAARSTRCSTSGGSECREGGGSAGL